VQLHAGIIILGTKRNEKQFRDCLPEESPKLIREELNTGLVAKASAGEEEAGRRSAGGGGGGGGHGALLAGELWSGRARGREGWRK